jgi:hypothetical protein
LGLTIKETDLVHYGIIRRSGRYPWGSGSDTKGQSELTAGGFIQALKDLRKSWSDGQITEWLGMTTTELRARNTIALDEHKIEQVSLAQRLKDKGYSNKAIAERMGLAGESSVRALLADGALDKKNQLLGTADMLHNELKKGGYIDVGEGVATHLATSRENLNAALAILEIDDKGVVVPYNSPQVGSSNNTKRRALCPPGTTRADVWANQDKVRQLNMVTNDSGETWVETWKYALPVNPKRVEVVYGPDGGAEADGVIYVRPGVSDLTLGPKNYAQVRVQVGDGHYLKGMAVYKDDMPPGVDILYNTPKTKEDFPNKLDVMKKLEADPELPFGSVVRNIPDRDGPDWEPASAMNLVNDEGDWAKWSKTISSQMLSKQNPRLIKEQLEVTFKRRNEEYKEIMSLTNPTLKKKLLEEFAETTDKAAVDLKSAQLERSSWHVILPEKTLKPNEIYAPGYHDGETVALIRYPHAGPFEIPLLTVNNKNRNAKKIIGNNSKDAVAIHHSVAERLSGADFDGDTVLVIPNDNRTNKIKTQPALKDLEGFDPKVKYKGVEGKTRRMTKAGTQQAMGEISNLITDMQLQGASDSKVARAVKHSMVVIDAEKHGLDYRRSRQENGIDALKQEFQRGPDGKSGASTLISRARAEKRIDERKPRSFAKGGPVDPKTGELRWEPTNNSYINKDGVEVRRSTKVHRLADTQDAFTLTSKGKASPVAEVLYAEQSNRLKKLANQARLDAMATPKAKYSPSAKRVYASEVLTLQAKIAQYDRNKPRDRAAQDIANASLKERIRRNPELKDDKKKRQKVAASELRKARARTGVERIDFTFSDREWEAIQSGAISDHMMQQILKRADPDHVKQRATPKTHTLLNQASFLKAQAMLAQGHTRAEVAAALGVSTSTLDRATAEGGV